VPETAILRGGEVSPAAFRLYCYYCARRNNESGGWRVKNREAAEALDLSRSRVSEARKELLGEGWIVDLGADFIMPLMGFEAVESSTESVENSNADVENSNESVENSTLLIDKDRAVLLLTYHPRYYPHTHIHAARGPVCLRDSHGGPVGCRRCLCLWFNLALTSHKSSPGRRLKKGRARR
jgi:hypothetical protein